VRVCDAANTQDAARVMADGLGGAAVVWRDYRGGTADLYGQRVDAGGQVADQCTPPDPLDSDLPASTAAPQNYRTFDQTWFYWSGVGVRGLSGDWDIEVFDQGSFGLNPYPTCFGAPLAGSFGSATVDFVVGNFNDNHTPPGTYGVRAFRYSGTGGAVIEWDDGPQVITKDGAGVTSSPTWTGPLDVYDVGLSAGVTYWFELNHDPAADIRVLVFTSHGSPDYYYVAPRSARVAESTGRWTSYTAPATDFYGVVVVNENGVADDYTLKVWSTAPVDIGDWPPVRATGLRAVAPNPSAGAIQIQFALREAGSAMFEVLDMAGRMVARIPEQRRAAGTWSVGWEGRTSGGRPAPPGIYFVQMRVDGRRVGLARIALVR
jgi:flagellar hook capping protein FlgD